MCPVFMDHMNISILYDSSAIYEGMIFSPLLFCVKLVWNHKTPHFKLL